MTALRISVPASSANLGPAFDSAGIALNLYLALEVETQDEWEFIHVSDLLPTITTYEEHFIYQIAKQTADQFDLVLPPCKVRVTSDIPLARGLGSSAAAALAGVEMANQLCHLNLSSEAILKFGTALEGHPDNIAASLLGGLVISTLEEEEVHYVKLPLSELEAVISIPSFELKTEEARNVLPEHYTRKQAATASSLSNVLIAALASGNVKLAGEMMEKDLFHEPYRAGLLPHYEIIKREAKSAGSYGTVISGAGPSMISFAQKGAGCSLARHLQELFPDFQVKVAQIDQEGIQINSKLS